MKWILFGFQIFPYVLDAVRAAETAIAGEGKGSAKLSLVLGIVETVYGALSADTKELPKEGMTKLVIGIIEKAVATFNAIGIFRTSQAA